MSWNNVKMTLPKIAASALAQYVVVVPDTTTDSQVFTAADNTVLPVGVALATVPTYGYEAGIAVEGVVKVLVAASIGAGALAHVASSNGAIGPIAASGVVASTAAGQAARFAVGVVQEARAAGEYASLFISPREII